MTNFHILALKAEAGRATMVVKMILETKNVSDTCMYICFSFFDRK